MVLFGLVDYPAASHELQSDFNVNVLVNGKLAGQPHFVPADALAGTAMILNVDARSLQAGSNHVEVVRRNGTGPVYWSANGRYYTSDKSQYQAGAEPDTRLLLVAAYTKMTRSFTH